MTPDNRTIILNIKNATAYAWREGLTVQMFPDRISVRGVWPSGRGGSKLFEHHVTYNLLVETEGDALRDAVASVVRDRDEWRANNAAS